MQARIAQRNQIGGWGFSLFFHAFLLTVIWPAFHQLPTPIPLEPFQWNVTFVELPQQASVLEPTNVASAPNLRSETSDVGEETQVPPIHNLPSPVSQQPQNEIKETIQVAKNVSSKMADPVPPVIAPAQAEVAPETTSTTEPAPVVQETVPEQRRVEHTQPMVATPPVATEPPPAIAASAEQKILPSPTQPATDVAMAPGQSHEPLQTPPTSAPPMASNQRSVAPADYGWLQRAVSRRLEELKRSSQPSLSDASRLKVLVRAVVSNTGELMEAEVVTSSGLDRIDREAMTLVHRAFPMSLDHTLDRQQIVMRIPITYSRD